MNSNMPVLAFVWCDDSSRAAELDAFFQENRRSRRRAPRIGAFLAARPATQVQPRGKAG